MIELSGFSADEDIKIEYSGLRPGEKLYEEPIHEAENVVPTSHPKIKCLIRNGDYREILEELKKIQRKLHFMSDIELKQWLSEIVPEYKIWEG
jgi:FlaA1/EpsC-like NDP-sugar epimerase